MLEDVGAAVTCVRALESTYATQARADFERYVRRTLHFSQRLGGRFNPPCEFGAIYTASDEATAWAELHARFIARASGLPPQWACYGSWSTVAATLTFARRVTARITKGTICSPVAVNTSSGQMHAIGMNVAR
jgi:RES domain-containing protein